MIVSPLIGQEKIEKESARRSIHYKRPVFGLNLDLGMSYVVPSYIGLNAGITPEFYIGKKSNVYFYLQLPLQFQGFYTYSKIPSFFGLGVLLGMGGYILEANNSNPWSFIMNGAVGGMFLFRNTQLGQGYNGTSTELSGEGIVMYLEFLTRYHMNDTYAVQFGPVLDVVWPIIPKLNISFKVGLAF